MLDLEDIGGLEEGFVKEICIQRRAVANESRVFVVSAMPHKITEVVLYRQERLASDGPLAPSRNGVGVQLCLDPASHALRYHAFTAPRDSTNLVFLPENSHCLACVLRERVL